MKFLPALMATALAVATSTCASAQGPASPETATPTMSALAPNAGGVGTLVTISGSSFAADGNTVRFGSGYIKNLSSTDGRTLRFTVPATLDECPPASMGLGVPCPETQRPVTAGAYAVFIVDRSGTSNELSFTVRQN